MRRVQALALDALLGELGDEGVEALVRTGDDAERRTVDGREPQVVGAGDAITIGEGPSRKRKLDTVFRTSLVINF